MISEGDDDDDSTEGVESIPAVIPQIPNEFTRVKIKDETENDSYGEESSGDTTTMVSSDYGKEEDESDEEEDGEVNLKFDKDGLVSVTPVVSGVNSSSSEPTNSSVAQSSNDRALQFKEEGNCHMSNKEFQKAVKSYTESIKLNPSLTASFNNRALSFMSLQVQITDLVFVELLTCCCILVLRCSGQRL
jgi:hypothetical protein